MSQLAKELSDLQFRITTGKPQPAIKPTELSLRSIKTVEAVFQHRRVNAWSSEPHIEGMAKVLSNDPSAKLEPITVFWVGDGWCCIDGHHRLSAYRESGYSTCAPVEVFEGTLQDAIVRALASNSKDKLPMSSAEKSDSAWRLTVCIPSLSKRELAKASTVSERTIAYMREARDQLRQAGKGSELTDMSWKRARLEAMGLESTQSLDFNEHVEIEGQKLADRLTRTFGAHLNKDPAILAKALSICNDSLPRRLAEVWSEEGLIQLDEMSSEEEAEF